MTEQREIERLIGKLMVVANAFNHHFPEYSPHYSVNMIGGPMVQLKDEHGKTAVALTITEPNEILIGVGDTRKRLNLDECVSWAVAQ